jgi:site-specific DNA-adenine methylase
MDKINQQDTQFAIETTNGFWSMVEKKKLLDGRDNKLQYTCLKTNVLQLSHKPLTCDLLIVDPPYNSKQRPSSNTEDNNPFFDSKDIESLCKVIIDLRKNNTVENMVCVIFCNSYTISNYIEILKKNDG